MQHQPCPEEALWLTHSCATCSNHPLDLADLRLAVRIHANQLERWTIEDRFDGLGRNFTRGALHNANFAYQTHIAASKIATLQVDPCRWPVVLE